MQTHTQEYRSNEVNHISLALEHENFDQEHGHDHHPLIVGDGDT
jgi:hypothetical protein